jgi:transcription elongation factor Elf1
VYNYLNKYSYAICYGGYQLFHEYITQLLSKEEYDEYLTRLYKFKAIEQKILLAKHYFNSNSELELKVKNTCKYIPQDIPISLLYDENGIKHKWDIYCYEDEELTLNQLKSKDDWSDPVLDVKCSICGIRKLNIKTLDVKKIQKSLTAMAEIDGFYIFYESRCPEGDIHSWNNKQCKKCGIQVKYITNRDSNAKEYYHKYYDIFKKMSNDVKLGKDSMDKDNNVDKHNDKHKHKNEDKHKNEAKHKNEDIDFSWVIKLSKLFSLNVHTLELIGCTQFQLFDDIIAGNKSKMDPIESIYDARIYNADAEIRYLFTMYSLLANADKMPNYTIITILEKSKIPKYEYKNLHKYLPKINSEKYNNDYGNAKNTLPPDEIFRFTILHLCYFIVKITEGIKKIESEDAQFTEVAINHLCMEFGRFIITKIINNQKLLSIPVNFNWKFFTDVADDEFDSEQVSGFEDEEYIRPEDLEFSSDNIDYDVNGDGEGDNMAGVDF